jgi:hypothetical protein
MVFAFISFAFAILFSTLSGLGYSVWIYSCFLTLREWQIVLYLLFLVVGVIYGITNIFTQPAEVLIFYIINLVFLCFAVYFCWLAYKAFRMSGGIHGGLSREERAKLKEESKEKSLKE